MTDRNQPTMEREVTHEEAGQRLDRLLAQWWAHRSRTVWQRAIRNGQVRVNGRVAKPNVIVSSGDRIQASLPPEPTSAPIWDDAPIAGDDLIVYHDAHIVVVNKPRGLVTHPARGHWDDSLVHRLLPYLEDNGQEPIRPGIVHRLDRDTTGLLVVARTEHTRRQLSAMILDRQVHRHYLAVVRGHLSPAQGLVDAPLARDPRNRLRMTTLLGGREARTHYRVVARWPSYDLVQCILDTGRTHQIRVHMSILGHPVLGDALYGGKDSLGSNRHLPGQFLHAAQLAFRHPISGQPLCFVAPLPADWNVILEEPPTVVEDQLTLAGDGCPVIVLLSYLGQNGAPTSTF